jgi:hypothetical protein
MNSLGRNRLKTSSFHVDFFCNGRGSDRYSFSPALNKVHGWLVVVLLFQADLIGSSVQGNLLLATLLQRESMVRRLNLTARQSLEAT